MKDRKAKNWELALFGLNDGATNIVMMLMAFVSYLYTGAIGTSVIFISTFLTVMRIWDAVTDPVIGVIIDRTHGKIGKFRPMIILGYLLMAVSLLIMFFAAPTLGSQGARLAVFIVSYLVYVVGYTFQTACTKAGQSCMTIDPEQRPVITRSMGIVDTLVFAAVPMLASMYLAPKYGGFTVDAMHEFCIIALAAAGILTVLVIIGMWHRDNEANWGVAREKKISAKEYLGIIKSNHPLQLLIVSAASDKIATLCSSNSSVTIMLFGIILGNYALNGRMSLIMLIPSIVFITLGTAFAKKNGFKKTLTVFSVSNIIIYAIIGILVMTLQPTASGITAATVFFLILYVLGNGSKGITNAMANPMIADCTDYEIVRSGNYAPGIIGTIFSFVDKVVSSFSSTIVGVMLVHIGYTSAMPQPGDALTEGIRTVTLVCFVILPILGWLTNIIAMKFYKLDHNEMEKIHEQLVEMKKTNGIEEG